MVLVEVIFGWPAVLASILVTTAGIAFRTAKIALVGALIATPFMIYLFATPRFRLIALPVLCAQYATAHAVRRDRRDVAAGLFAPFILLVIYVMSLVGSQFVGCC